MVKKVISKNKTACRLCSSSKLSLVLKLESTPPANAFISKKDLDKDQNKYPLEVYFCESCAHLQLLEVVDPVELFENYVYVSGTSKVFVNHFSDYAKSIIKKYNPSKENFVLDIGSNDGTFLKFFKNMGFSVLGVDPAKEISRKAQEEGINMINDFFTLETSSKIKKRFGKASLITANNVFAHSDNLIEMTQAISDLLTKDGLFVFEVSYLLDVYQKTLFDTIYHEHLSYHSVIPLIKFFENNGMTLIDVSRVNTHGGSIRCVVQKKNGKRNVNESVKKLIDLEKSVKLNEKITFSDFALNIKQRKIELYNFLSSLKSQKKTIAGFGAPAKATTLMYEFGLNQDILDFLIDDSPLKQGLYSPGLHLPVLSSDSIIELKPDYLLILAWNFADSIIKKNHKFSDSGGKFIIPLPNLEIV